MSRHDEPPDGYELDFDAASRHHELSKEFATNLEALSVKLAALKSRSRRPRTWVIRKRQVLHAAKLLLRHREVSKAFDSRSLNDVFLSFKTEDKPFASEIRSRLKAEGLTVFMAVHSIEAGSDWEEEIFHALRHCKTALFLVTPRSAKSEWCNYELGAARALEKQVVCGFRHIAAREIPEALRRFQALDVQTTRGAIRLIKRVATLVAQAGD